MQKSDPKMKQAGEAQEAFKKGEKSIKTGIFKWSPDYVEGAMYFQQAGKGFKALGMKNQAREAYLKFSHCSEKTNEFFGAAEGLAEAAFFEDNKKKSYEYLLQAMNYFKIQDATNQGVNFMKKFASKLIESDSKEEQEFGEEVYEMLFNEALEGDGFIWHPDIVSDYVSILVQNKKYGKAIKAKKEFIKYLKSQGTIDHQMRRAYLEIVCLQIVAEDFYKIEDTLNEFHENHGGNAYGQDEFNICSELNDAVKAKDFKQIEKICRKPLFGFIDNETVKSLKKLALNPPYQADNALGGNSKSGQFSDEPKSKQQVLNNILL